MKCAEFRHGQPKEGKKKGGRTNEFVKFVRGEKDKMKQKKDGCSRRSIYGREDVRRKEKVRSIISRAQDGRMEMMQKLGDEFREDNHKKMKNADWMASGVWRCTVRCVGDPAAVLRGVEVTPRTSRCMGTLYIDFLKEMMTGCSFDRLVCGSRPQVQRFGEEVNSRTSCVLCCAFH